jgi:hypothetical protein
LENSRKKYQLEDLGLDGKIVIKWMFKEWNEEVWIWLICLRIGTDGGLL